MRVSGAIATRCCRTTLPTLIGWNKLEVLEIVMVYTKGVECWDQIRRISLFLCVGGKRLADKSLPQLESDEDFAIGGVSPSDPRHFSTRFYSLPYRKIHEWCYQRFPRICSFGLFRIVSMAGDVHSLVIAR